MKQAHITEHHSRQWFEQLFEGLVADYHLSDASDFLTFRRRSRNRSNACGSGGRADLFQAQGNRRVSPASGREIDDRDARGRTALMIAAEGGHGGIAHLLLARGADPELKDKDGKRAADLTVLTSLRERLTPR